MSFQLSLSTESVSAAYPDQPVFVTPASTVGEVIQLLRAQHTGSVLVCDNDSDNLLGIFTERDALKCMAAVSAGTKQAEPGDGVPGDGMPGDGVLGDGVLGDGVMGWPVSAVMSTDVVTLEANTSMGEAIKLMSQGNYRHLPIVDAGRKPTGMETVYGIVRYLVDHFPQTIYNLPPNPRSGTSEREGA